MLEKDIIEEEEEPDQNIIENNFKQFQINFHEEEEPDQNIIEYNSKKFKLNYYSDSEKIIIKLESINEDPKIIFGKIFKLQQLREISNYFKIADNIEGALTSIHDLMKQKITIEKKNENEINLIIPYEK